ncbi:MAG: hypothetical protein JWR12_3135 [Mucilaginibacter sp.]|nr:hypothetical protein [Mucilaginibacter sp.]
MSFSGLILTKKQHKTNAFNFREILNLAFKFVKNTLFKFKKCKNYTIDNFTNR